MKVLELKKVIADLPDDMEVILQKDAEGNGYSPLAGADPEGIYIPESSYSGEVYTLSWTAYDACLSEEEWKQVKQKPKSLILFPVN